MNNISPIPNLQYSPKQKHHRTVKSAVLLKEDHLFALVLLHEALHIVPFSPLPGTSWDTRRSWDIESIWSCDTRIYPLVNVYTIMENHHAIFMGKSTISTGPWLHQAGYTQMATKIVGPWTMVSWWHNCHATVGSLVLEWATGDITSHHMTSHRITSYHHFSKVTWLSVTICWCFCLREDFPSSHPAPSSSIVDRHASCFQESISWGSWRRLGDSEISWLFTIDRSNFNHRLTID